MIPFLVLYHCTVGVYFFSDTVACPLPKEVTDRITQLETLATHPNGQLYKDHWGACALNNYQLWEALRECRKN